MRRKENRDKPGSAYGPRGSQGPLGVSPGHPVADSGEPTAEYGVVHSQYGISRQTDPISSPIRTATQVSMRYKVKRTIEPGPHP